MTNITNQKHSGGNTVNIESAQAIRVHLVAPALTAWGLERMLEGATPRMQVVGQTGSVAEALPGLQASRPHVVVVDLDGEDQLASLTHLALQGQARVLAIAGTLNTMQQHDSAILAGARGVVSKRESPTTLLKAIEKVHEGEIWIDRDATGRIFMQLAKRKAAQPHNPVQSKIDSLTRRERQAVVALASDASAPGKVIANRLNMSEHTLRNHLTAIYDKLDLSNRVDLYAFAHRHGLVSTAGAA